MRRLAILVVFTLPAVADEGMWLLDQFPASRILKKYGFQVGPAFLNHLRLASARLNSGGSGSFVSPRGLLLTNHHIAAECIQKIGTAEHDYMRDGFYASTLAQELKCPDLEVNVLLRTENVTGQVQSAIPAGATPEEANQRRKASIARLEKECAARNGNRCDVVTLFSGHRYDLYEYKKYTDLRLVFAPEFLIAFFGGEADNFTYPRYNLDVSFFRAYENGKPAGTPENLRWSREGVRNGQLIFVAGNPGSTSRFDTVAELEFARDIGHPLEVERFGRRIRELTAYRDRSAENRRLSHDLFHYFQNNEKAVRAELEGLREPAAMNRKKQEERKLRMAVQRDPKLAKAYSGVWNAGALAYKEWSPYEKAYVLLEQGPMGSDLFHIARRALRLPTELAKSNDHRLTEYRDSALPSLELRLYSPAPISNTMEAAILGAWFQEMLEWLGPADATVKSVLAGKSPREAAEEYIRTTKLEDIIERKRIANSREAAQSSPDGMMRMARAIDLRARELRKRREDTIEAAHVTFAARIAAARVAVYGSAEYPDATFTPRISYGKVEGYRGKVGNAVPWNTTFAGLYEKAKGGDPYLLPPRWINGQKKLDLHTALNFVSTADIAGGSSGSPTVNTSGELVGIVFDGNIESLPNTFFYTETRARSIHVAGQGIVEALRKLYHADPLLKELGIAK